MPPNSSDFNPCDFTICSVVERNTNISACNTLAQLKTRSLQPFDQGRGQTHLRQVQDKA
ncbi:Hypothetical protein FKW44_000272 [Caligus rogercresseyi]|uniref:Uncharacterized protein n=1 Tax=Caligus rogercresseyi TaxID=217165 RepID=A0A7T8QUS2_CALRO|nr:Hypothetical protein FKW44_000272 [Caligus rogercresseyi]